MGWWLAGVAHAACMVIAGGTVHTSDGAQRGATVVLDGARIAGVGVGIDGLALELDAQARVQGATFDGQDCGFVQAANHHVTPGFVAAPTQLGLVEISLEKASRNDDPGTEDPVRAALRAADAYNPLSSLIGVARVEGITSAVTAPSGGFVSGAAAFVRLDGATQADAVVSPAAAMVVRLPSESVAEGIRQLRELFTDVAAFRQSRRTFDAGRMPFSGASRLDLEALVPVLEGKMPLLVVADQASAIESLLRLEREFGFDLVIGGASEGWMHADALAAAGVAVSVDPLVFGPGGFDQLHARPDNAALLAEAGVPLLLVAGDEFFATHHARGLRQNAGNAVREGLSYEAAMAAVTEHPAAVFGQPDRGRLAAGAIADVVLWTGDPFELSSQVVGVWIDGQRIALESRQTHLRDKYRTLPGTPAVPLNLPTQDAK